MNAPEQIARRDVMRLDEAPAPVAVSEARVPEGWRTMESAPKDGREVIYLRGDGEVSVCRWDAMDAEHFEPGWYDPQLDNDCSPKGWIPRPSFPAPPPPRSGAMDSMIDRVGRAICGECCGWDECLSVGRSCPHDRRAEAHAAIGALREPTPAMLDAAMDQEATDLASEYRAMIDAVLASPTVSDEAR